MDDGVVGAGQSPRWHRWIVWAGRLVSCAPVAVVLMSARWKLTSDPWYVQEWGRIGWNADALPLIASLQLAAIVLYESGIRQVPDESAKVEALRAIGIRFLRFRADSLPRPAEVRNLVLA